MRDVGRNVWRNVWRVTMEEMCGNRRRGVFSLPVDVDKDALEKKGHFGAFD